MMFGKNYDKYNTIDKSIDYVRQITSSRKDPMTLKIINVYYVNQVAAVFKPRLLIAMNSIKIN